MRFMIQLSYNGHGFHGWQRQNNAPSIQQEIEEKLTTVFRIKTAIVGCGRTDTGVHATQYFAHFETDHEFNAKDLTHKLNSMLPVGIAVQRIFPISNDGHARFSATKRSYEYRITKVKNPFATDLAYRFNLPLDLERMNKACIMMLGEQDFGCFCKANADNHTNICNVSEAKWTESDNMLVFQISANRFLRNMVRAVVGTMLEIGQDRMSLADFQAVLDSKDRTYAGPSVPPHGLYLTAVEYPSEIFLPNP